MLNLSNIPSEEVDKCPQSVLSGPNTTLYPFMIV